jgi:hypothetical protein
MEARLLHAPQPLDRRSATVDFARVDSPETYVGYGRAKNFSSAEPPVHDRAADYTAPRTLGLNDWALRGTWKITGQSAKLEAAAGSVRFRFKAPKLNLVMSGSGNRVNATVLLDGEPLRPDARGSDTGADGRVVVGAPRLYNLVALPAMDARDHVFEIRFDEAGVELYAFTFG